MRNSNGSSHEPAPRVRDELLHANLSAQRRGGFQRLSRTVHDGGTLAWCVTCRSEHFVQLLPSLSSLSQNGDSFIAWSVMLKLLFYLCSGLMHSSVLLLSRLAATGQPATCVMASHESGQGTHRKLDHQPPLQLAVG